MDILKILGQLLQTSQTQPPARRKPAARPRKTTVTRTMNTYQDEQLAYTIESALYPVPQQIRQMRTISGYTAKGTRTMESVFYAQGKYMERYTDDFPDNTPCNRVMPSYSNMSNDELRTYFTWRTRYRMGALPAAQNAFLLLYTYELLNLIGVTSAGEAYDILQRLSADYGESFPAWQKLLRRWMQDFSVYYGLPYRCDDPREAAAMTIVRHSAHSAEELLRALCVFSKYKLLDSRLYQAQPEQTAEVLAYVYKRLLLHYAEVKKQSLCAYLMGDNTRQRHLMFEGALFWFRSPHKDGSFRLSPLCVYHCYQDHWAVERFCAEPKGDRIGALLRTVDSLLREAVHFKGKLKTGELPEGDEDVIRQAIAEYFAEQRRKSAPVIELDAAELEQIRAAAAHTTDMLTLPEDMPAETVPETPAEPDSAAAPAEAALPDLPVSAPAGALLLCLLTGESYQPLLDAGHMPEVLADEINEAFYDAIGDTVLEVTDGMPMLIPDYIDELKGMLQT